MWFIFRDAYTHIFYYIILNQYIIFSTIDEYSIDLYFILLEIIAIAAIKNSDTFNQIFVQKIVKSQNCSIYVCILG